MVFGGYLSLVLLVCVVMGRMRIDEDEGEMKARKDRHIIEQHSNLTCGFQWML